jgi:hypothetical protein
MYDCETQTLNFEEEHKLPITKNSVLEKYLDLKMSK